METSMKFIGLVAILLFLVNFVGAVAFIDTPINTTIIPSAYPNYNYQVASAPYEAYFKNNSDLTKAVRVIMNGYIFDFDIATSQAQWYNSSNGAIMGNSLNPLNTNATTTGSTLTYPNAWSGTNLSYSLFDNEVKETLAITSIPNPVGVADYFRYKINLYYNNSLQVCFDNGTCYLHPSNVKVVTDGGITFKDAKNTTIFYIPPPNVTDSAGNSANATYFLNLNNGVDLWYLAVPKSFINIATFPIYLDPTVTLTAGAPFPIVLTPLNGTRVVIGYTGSYYYKFQIYDVNGTQVVAETSSNIYSEYVPNPPFFQMYDSAPFNSSSWVTCISDAGGSASVSEVCSIFSYSGTTATQNLNITVATSTETSKEVAVTTFSSTMFGVFFDWASANDIYAVYYSNGTQKCMVKVSDFYASGALGISAYNSTHAGLTYENASGGIVYKTYDTSCSQTAYTVLTANINYGKRMHFKTVNNTYGVMAAYDYSVADGDAFEVVDSSGTAQTAYTQFLNIKLNRNVVGLSVSNDTNFSVGSMNDTGPWSNYSFKSYNIAGVAQTGIINVETLSTLVPDNSVNEFSMSSWEQAVGIGFCQKEGMAIAYDNTSTQSILAFYYMNGTAWDGSCPSGGAPPTYIKIGSSLDIGDPLYCSIPSITGAVNTEILCMPKDNLTGSPVTGGTVICQANAQGLYTATIQAASTAGERSYGVYNWTFLGSSMTAGSSYTINCSSVLGTGGTAVNGFAASIYIIPNLSSQVQALTANITSVNNTVIAVGSNLTTANTNILAVGSNLTSHNTTMNTQYGLLAQNLTLIQGNLTAMITAASSHAANTTAINNSLGTFITASYSNFNNVTAVNNSLASFYGKTSQNLTLILGKLTAMITSASSHAANTTAINNSLGTFITASYSNFNNVTAINNTLATFITASYSNFLNNTAMNNSMTAYYNALANNLTNHNTTMVAEYNVIGTNLTYMNTTLVATNNSLQVLMTASASNFLNNTAMNNSLTAYYNALANNLTAINVTIVATNNSLNTFYNNLANNLTSINATQNANFGAIASNLTSILTNVATVNTNVIAVGSNLTNHNTTMVAEFGAIASNLTNIQNGITATNNSLTAYYNALANNLTSVNNTVIEVGFNLSALNIDALAVNITNINSTLVATNNSLQVLMTASASNFLNNTAMNNSMTSYYINLGNNITSVNNTVIAVGTNLTAYYHAIAANMTSFNTTSFAMLAALGVNITSVNNTVIIVGSNLTTNMTRLYNILAAIAMCIPCPIGGLVGEGGSTTIPAPMGFGPQNVSVSIPQAPVTNLIAGVAGFLLIICGGMYLKLRNEKKKVKKAKGVIASKDEEKKKSAKPR